ncbi:hypothetical protein Ancab_008319 [Ancistrocladus abbreviatus]
MQVDAIISTPVMDCALPPLTTVTGDWPVMPATGGWWPVDKSSGWRLLGAYAATVADCRRLVGGS